MHMPELLHKIFAKELPQIHKKRLSSLFEITSAGVSSNQLYLTGLGRLLSNNNKESSNIQKVDRLLGNGHLQAEKELFYRVMLSQVIQENSQPWIHIDWTCINAVTNLYALRASLSMKGRSLVIYEECYPKKKENNHATHKAFLNCLKGLLPSSATPTIVTDAGFRGLWFAHVLKLNWNFVGRLRNKNAVCINNASHWKLSSEYFEQATGKPTYIGHGPLTEEGKIPTNFVLYRGQALNKKKRKPCKSKRYSKAHKEPWMLVTSLPQAKFNPALIVTIYRQRMRIEENIRDTKCAFYGLGLKNSLTRCPQRMNILLLIAAIATYTAWLAGLFIKSIGKAADFQAHSSKFTSALSTVFLGRRALKKIPFTPLEFEDSLTLLHLTSIQSQMETFHYE